MNAVTRSCLFQSTVVAISLMLFLGCNAKQQVKIASNPSSLSAINKSKRISAGWAPYAPYISLNTETKKPEGFYVDLVEAMASEAGWEVNWVETTWGNMITDLNTGRFDVMAAPVFRTISRETEVDFTRSIDFFGLNAVVRKDDDKLITVADLDQGGVTVTVTQGEVGQDFAQRHMKNAKVEVHKTGDISLALVDVIQKRADVGICDSWTAKQFVEKHNGNVRLLMENPFAQVGAGWFVRQGDTDLLQFLNVAIDWLESSGAVKTYSEKYDLGSFLKE